MNQAHKATCEPQLQAGQVRPGALGFVLPRVHLSAIRSNRASRLVARTVAPDGLAPSELKVRSYTAPPTPPQPPTGLPRRSSRFPAIPRHQRPCSPRRARPVGAEGSQLPHAANATAAPDGLAPSELKVRSYPPPPTPPQPPTGLPRRGVASEPWLQTGRARLGARQPSCQFRTLPTRVFA